MKTATLISCALALSLGSHANLSLAEEVVIPVGSQASNVKDKPQRGISREQVEAKYGAPMSKNGPTGEPPIYFWEYDTFTVYFENNIVIHSVSKFKSNKAVKKH